MKAETDNKNTINILTDARHGWRKNAKQTDVVCIGAKTKRVLYVSTITKEVDDVAQRHELHGTKEIYRHIADKGLGVAAHCHDNNAVITKYVRESQPATRNQLDNWHALKSFEKAIKGITKGPKKNHGKTWHFQLTDKAHSLRTHVNFCLSKCNDDAQTLQTTLLACIEHYKNNHSQCFPTARCKQDPNYEPSRIVITDVIAEQMLRNAIISSNVYRKASLYTMNMSTAHVESFNNQLNIFQDKRICFGNLAYKMRTKLAVCIWNENQTLECKKRSYEDFLFRHQILYKYLGI